VTPAGDPDLAPLPPPESLGDVDPDPPLPHVPALQVAPSKEQSWQAAPERPQDVSRLPVRQAPEVSQQPVHVAPPAHVPVPPLPLALPVVPPPLLAAAPLSLVPLLPTLPVLPVVPLLLLPLRVPLPALPLVWPLAPPPPSTSKKLATPVELEPPQAPTTNPKPIQ